MIFRILLLLLLVGFLFWVFKKPLAARDRDRQAAGEDEAEDMLVCETCGVHAPRSMTVRIDGRTYCCEEHARSANPDRTADDE